MIKKIILITLAAMLLLTPAASANDSSYYDGKGKIGVKIIPSSFRANIGEDYSFTVEIKNYTAQKFDYVIMENMFSSFDYEQTGVDIEIKPYRSVEFEVTVFIYDGIDWYKDENGYFITLMPVFTLCVEDSSDMYGVNPEKEITIEIDNINDGSEYMKISYLDDRTLFPYFNYCAFEHFRFKTYILIENISDNDYLIKRIKDNSWIEDSESNKTSREYDYLMKSGSAVTCETEKWYNIEEQTENPMVIDYQVLFLMDGKYYAAGQKREMETLNILRPDVEVRTNVLYDERGEKYTKYTIENISDKDIENFIVSYSEGRIFGTMEAGEIWEVPIEYTGEYDDSMSLGYYIEDCLYSWRYSFEYKDSDGTIKASPKASVDFWDYYWQVHNVEMAEPQDNSQEFVFMPIQVPTATPINYTNTPAHNESTQEIKSYYIPLWAWIAAAAAAIASSALIYYIVKKGKKDSND